MSFSSFSNSRTDISANGVGGRASRNNRALPPPFLPEALAAASAPGPCTDWRSKPGVFLSSTLTAARRYARLHTSAGGGGTAGPPVADDVAALVPPAVESPVKRCKMSVAVDRFLELFRFDVKKKIYGHVCTYTCHEGVDAHQDGRAKREANHAGSARKGRVVIINVSGLLETRRTQRNQPAVRIRTVVTTKQSLTQGLNQRY